MTLIMVLFFLFFLATSSGISLRNAEKKHRTLYGHSKYELRNMSWVGKELIKEYNSLPAQHRPYANMRHIAEALDIKHDAQLVNGHFRKMGYESSYPSWDCDCRITRFSTKAAPCPYFDYKQLHDSFVEINNAEKERQHAYALVNVQDGLHQAEQLMESLREERDLMKSVTKEIAP